MPSYRFLNRNGDSFPAWKKVKLSDVLVERKTSKTIDEDTPLLAFTIEEGVIDPKEKKTNKKFPNPKKII